MKGIIGTAGHIDHGKTALIGALTGEQTDRLPEEQRRGISIDLGFSHLELGEGRFGIVDVPGHEDFIRNMLAGATGLDLLLLVIAADEGVMPQTREHTAIGELLGLERAVVALTKVDLVDDDWLGLVHDDIAGFLADTPFAGAPVVPTSAVTGQGLDELRSALSGVFRGSRGRHDDLFRLPIDRVFTVRGTGTVVTGTVWSGQLERDAVVRLLPGGPEGRVRSLQVHGAEVERIEAGERAAVALAGVERDQVERGMAVVADEGWDKSSILTVRLRVLPGSDWTIEPRQRVRVHVGTAEVMARVVLLQTEPALLPGESAWAQLRLEAPVLARTGDRLVVRSYSPVTTIGGGMVVEAMAPRRNRLETTGVDLLKALMEGAREAAVDALIRSSGTGGVAVPSLPVLTGSAPAEVDAALARSVRVRDRAYSTEALGFVRERLLEEVTGYHREHHLDPGMDPEALRRACEPADPALVERALDELVSERVLASRRGRIARGDWEIEPSGPEQELMDRIVRAIAEQGMAPPRLDELAVDLERPAELEALLGVLEADGRLIRLEHDLYIDAEALHTAVAAIKSRFSGRSGLGPGDFRELVDVSRRHLMPLLGYLDREGITVRSGEGRAVL